MNSGRAALVRQLLAEYLGTALLVVAVVGSGIMASRLSPADVGLQLLENSIATMLALAVLILTFGPVSGAHFNPLVTIADWVLLRRAGQTPRVSTVVGYGLVQLAGAISGAILANVMFSLPAVTFSTAVRTGPAIWIGEVVATSGLIVLIFSLVRTHRTGLIPAAVGAYIGAAYWFTSSTSFANPAVTIGRAFTDTFAGIAPASLPGFVAAQLVGAIVGVALIVALYPKPVTTTADTAAIESGAV